MTKEFKIYLEQQLADIKQAGLFKTERIIASPQGTTIKLQDGSEVLNFCANNYLGLADHPDVIAAAKQALDQRGYGLASVRFICGTQDGHKNLEAKISKFLGTDETILYGSAFDANGGLFETLLGAEDAIISDALNHASIIDGVHLCKAQRFRYQNADMADLEEQLKQAAGARFRLIVTDGVFSMDGILAPLDQICDLADKYGALVMVDDSHATGFIGPSGRGTADYYGVTDRIDIITSTLGKALGGAMGGFTSGRQAIIDLLRQRSRPYLFSNSLAPMIVGAANIVLDLVTGAQELREKVMANAAYFRDQLTAAGFAIKPGIHPIIPVMLYDAVKAQEMAQKLLAEGIYVIGFFYPVVPQGQARIRVQVSAAHSREQLDRAIAAFLKVGRELTIIN
jgi:glycine C-acetyltransferase